MYQVLFHLPRGKLLVLDFIGSKSDQLRKLRQRGVLNHHHLLFLPDKHHTEPLQMQIRQHLPPSVLELRPLKGVRRSEVGIPGSRFGLLCNCENCSHKKVTSSKLLTPVVNDNIAVYSGFWRTPSQTSTTEPTRRCIRGRRRWGSALSLTLLLSLAQTGKGGGSEGQID